MEYDDDVSCELIGIPVGLYQRHLTFLTRMGITVLHAQHTLVAFRMDVGKDGTIVHFPRAGFITAGVIPYLEVADLAVGMVDQADDIPLVALYMIHIEQDLTRGTVDGPADGIALIGVPEEEVRGVAQRFQHHDDLVRLQYFHAP